MAPNIQGAANQDIKDENLGRGSGSGSGLLMN